MCHCGVQRRPIHAVVHLAAWKLPAAAAAAAAGRQRTAELWRLQRGSGARGSGARVTLGTQCGSTLAETRSLSTGIAHLSREEEERVGDAHASQQS